MNDIRRVRFNTRFQRVTFVLGCGLIVFVSGCGDETTSDETDPILHAMNRLSQERNPSEKRLQQLGLGVMNYLEMHRTLPPAAITDAAGRALHGWMYAMAPGLELSSISRQINKDAPWDDPINRSSYHVTFPAGINPAMGIDENNIELIHYSGNSHVFITGQGMKYTDVSDSFSNTLGIGEINSNFPVWGQPGNVRDPVDGLNLGGNTFGSPFEGGVHFLFLDGSVKFLSDTIDKELLTAISTPAGGEKLTRTPDNELQLESQ